MRVVVASDLLIVGGAGGAPEYLATFHLLFMRGHASVALTREVPARFLRGKTKWLKPLAKKLSSAPFYEKVGVADPSAITSPVILTLYVNGYHKKV